MIKNSRCFFLVPALLIAVTLTAGCTVQKLPPVEVYTLEPQWSQGLSERTEKKGSVIIQIAPVRGGGAFTTTDILYSDRRNSQHSYAYSRWREAPVRSMQTVLEVAVEKTGLFQAVLPPTSVSAADLLLESTLLEFSHILREKDGSAGVVRVRFHLIDNRNRRVIATKELMSTVETVSSDARGATTAINQAVIHLAGDLGDWLEDVAR